MTRRLLALILTVTCICGLTSCAAGGTIGTVEGAENERIVIDGTTYLKDDPATESLSSADRGRHLGDVSNGKITMEVYSVQGDSEGRFIYALWDWEGSFYTRQDVFPVDQLIYGDLSMSESDAAIKPDALTRPPALIVSCEGGQVVPLVGTYSWQYRNAAGLTVATEADGMHPLEDRETLPSLPVGYSYKSSVNPFKAYLQFEVAPDAVEVRCWGEECWGDPSAPHVTLNAQAVEIDLVDGSWTVNYTINLLEGNYIYEIIARWEEAEERGYGGTVRYGFYTVMPSYEIITIGESFDAETEA